MNGADGENFFKAELCEFISAGFVTARVHFVGCDKNRFSTATQTFRNFAIERHDALLRVDDENNDVCGLNGQIHLFNRRFDDDITRLFAVQQSDAAGVHEREGAPVPFRFGADAVARDAGQVMHNGDAPSDDAVEQGGLADVGATDDGD